MNGAELNLICAQAAKDAEKAAAQAAKDEAKATAKAKKRCPGKQCEKPGVLSGVKKFREALECDNCGQWWHVACAELDGPADVGMACRAAHDADEDGEEELEWKCAKCSAAPMEVDGDGGENSAGEAAPAGAADAAAPAAAAPAAT